MVDSTSHESQEVIELSLCSETINVDKNEGAKFLFNPCYFLPVNVILSLFALSGNILNLIALQKDSTFHPPSKLLLRCLLSTDLSVGLISQPLFALYLMTVANRNWDICKITEGLAFIASTILCGESMLTLTAISVDRLLALLLAIRNTQVVSLKHVRLFVIISWILSFAVSLTYLWNKRFFFLGGCTCSLLCLSISTCCYTRIYSTLRHHQAQIQDHLQIDNPGLVGINAARYKRALSGAFWIYLALLVCYLPYTMAMAVGALRGLSRLLLLGLKATGIFVFVNSSLNPVLYYWKIREVRHAAKETMRKCFCCK